MKTNHEMTDSQKTKNQTIMKTKYEVSAIVTKTGIVAMSRSQLEEAYYTANFQIDEMRKALKRLDNALDGIEVSEEYVDDKQAREIFDARINAQQAIAKPEKYLTPKGMQS